MQAWQPHQHQQGQWALAMASREAALDVPLASRGGRVACCRVPPMQCSVAQLGALQFGQLDARLPTGVQQEPVLLGPLSGFGFGGVWVGIGKCVWMKPILM